MAHGPGVVCLGDPVVDLLAHTSQDSLRALGLEPGGCVAVERATLDAILAGAELTGPLSRVSGGSAANVAKGLAGLAGGAATIAFAGRTGNDAAGREYEAQLRAGGVEPRVCRSDDLPTASCLCLVTPDGQRTMRTCLAAAAQLQTPAQLGPGWLAGCRLLHMEGYVLYRPQLAREAIAAARQAGALVSIDLASFELVRGCGPALAQLLRERLLDVVICNQEEAQAVAQAFVPGATGDPVAAAQAFLLQHCQLSVVSLGPAGCSLRAAGQAAAVRCAAPAVAVADTVGAGDSFAAGVLHARLRGAPLQACGACGCLIGSASVQTAGAELSPAAWAALREQAAAICGPAAQRS